MREIPKICTVSGSRKIQTDKISGDYPLPLISVIKNMAELIQIHLELSPSRNSRSNTQAKLAVEKVQKYLRLITPNFDNEQEV